MEYCLISDAFPTVTKSSDLSKPSPGCSDTISSDNARKGEEKRKIRKKVCTPVALFEEFDPDRQHLKKTPHVNPMKKNKIKESFVENPREVVESSDNDILEHEEEKPEEDTEESFVQNFVTPVGSKKDGAYANFSDDNKNYLLEPSFKDAFVQNGISKTGSSSALPMPNTNDFWKPLTEVGVDTAFINKPSKYSKNIDKKLDILFAKLDDLQNGTSENAQLEITMFISIGLMIMFTMDILVKHSMK